MKLASFADGKVGLVVDGGLIDVSDIVGAESGMWPPVNIVRTIAAFDKHRFALETALTRSPLPLDDLKLECPVGWPNKVVAFPANYHAHIDEMVEANALISTKPASGQGFFLKANSSLSGPSDEVVLPDLPDREVHHECELALIIGKGGRNIPRDRALDHIFGYSCLIDFVVRGKEERVMRKSFDTFCPVGPYIVTADEIADPRNIELTLSVNGEERQSANTRDLIVDIEGMVSMASSVMTLQPGDIIASGTPAGVAPVNHDDIVRIAIDGVGEMTLKVVAGFGGNDPVWNS